LRRRNLLALLVIVLAALAVGSQADALTGLKTYKIVVINIQVTPSPAPLGWITPPTSMYPEVLPAGVQIASSGSAWDVAPGAPFVLAQTPVVQPSPSVPVQFVAKPDPNSAFLRVIPHTGLWSVPYGTTTLPCVFEIFTFYTNSYKLQDWGYGTTKTGGAGSGTFPIENYPAVSFLSWAVPDFGPAFTPYWNQGPGGEQTWSGLKNQAQQHCIDLTITVPNSQPAGSYTAVVQYNLYVTLP
jgi:hypothetical protein